MKLSKHNFTYTIKNDQKELDISGFKIKNLSVIWDYPNLKYIYFNQLEYYNEIKTFCLVNNTIMKFCFKDLTLSELTVELKGEY